jgi:tRNA dimethylallyltransferase
MPTQTVFCLMGPTASGKTEFAVQLAEALPVDVISVDSALVYRGMDIGTAKPDSETLRRVPHRLIDIRDPVEAYSAGDFVRDASREIDSILADGRTPLLVGGTMMYFRSLIHGIANLPQADATIRAAIDAEAAEIGWPAMHQLLAQIDAPAAARINANDSQRIQRALEVYRISGKTLSDWQATDVPRPDNYAFIKIALVSESRALLHERIAARLQTMIDGGFIDEVRTLMKTPGLTPEHPSMRAVGYRQIWSHLEGNCDLQAAREKALAATRQLAKRQLTWLRSEDSLNVVDPLAADAFASILSEFRAYSGDSRLNQ